MRNNMVKVIEDCILEEKRKVKKNYQIFFAVGVFIFIFAFLLWLQPLKGVYIIEKISFFVVILILFLLGLIVFILKAPYGKIEKPAREQVKAKAEEWYSDYLLEYEDIKKNCKELSDIISGEI